ncbi:uracil-DNA glycosylase [Novimethylophilus kurashikiensis]|uniref:Uracil-DNA glycosylase n=1 Tax=Novimethylophilus kurashikiensis TaxID=1825523 RepID=A0A2R5F8D9_9PROT|nr:hypothetical protein [Novimethylophilus kurashikiensis]GBG14295.1 uracil-DNA glycosylase [Novimethylophilus kurashikiensis]
MLTKEVDLAKGLTFSIDVKFSLAPRLVASSNILRALANEMGTVFFDEQRFPVKL